MRLIASLIVMLLGGTIACAADVQRTLALSGLTCTACSAAVTKALKQVDGVRDVTVNEDRTRAVVVADEAVPEDKLVQAITRLGYGARIATPE
jgi:copper chaperone CopZ